MYIKIGDLLNVAFGISNNPEGYPTEQYYQPVTVGYALYIAKINKDPRLKFKRLKDILVQSEAAGTDISQLGTKKGGNYNDFLVPYDIFPSDATGDTIDEDNELFPVENMRSSEKGYFTTQNKLYITGYSAGNWFRVRYFPEILPYNSTNYENLSDVELFIPQAHLPAWAKFLNSIQANLEEETIPIDQLEFEFDKYFEDLEGLIPSKDRGYTVDVDYLHN